MQFHGSHLGAAVRPGRLWQRNPVIRNHETWGMPGPPVNQGRFTITVIQCGRICFGRRKINLSTGLAGQNVGVKEVSDKIWLVSFMKYDLGFFDHETGRLESAVNPFGARVLPMSLV